MIALRIKFLLLYLILGLSQTSFAQIDLQLGSHWYFASEGLQADVLRDNWVASNKGGRSTFSARHYLSAKMNRRWLIGVERRSEFQLAMTHETAQFYARLEQNALPQGLYDLDLKVNAATGNGFFAQYFIPLSILDIASLTGHVYQGADVQNGYLQGEGEVFADGSFRYQYELDYRYAQNELVRSQGQNVAGYGYSFDVQLLKRLTDTLAIKLDVTDLFYRYHWQTVNYDQGCIARPANTCRVKTATTDYIQSFSANMESQIIYSPQPRSSYLLGIVRRWQQDDVYLGARLGNYGLSYNLTNQFVAFSLRAKRLQFSIATDKLPIQNSQQLQLGIDVNWPLP